MTVTILRARITQFCKSAILAVGVAAVFAMLASPRGNISTPDLHVQDLQAGGAAPARLVSGFVSCK